MAGNRRLSLDERLWQRLVQDPTTGCLVWQGAKTTRGYGVIGYEGKVVYVHRLVYKLLVGDIPEGMQLDHGEVCSNHACSNPEHIEVVTLEENVRRAAAKRTPSIYKTTPAARRATQRYRARKRSRQSLMLASAQKG